MRKILFVISIILLVLGFVFVITSDGITGNVIGDHMQDNGNILIGMFLVLASSVLMASGVESTRNP